MTNEQRLAEIQADLSSAFNKLMEFDRLTELDRAIKTKLMIAMMGIDTDLMNREIYERKQK
jgi:hypothetical protein